MVDHRTQTHQTNTTTVSTRSDFTEMCLQFRCKYGGLREKVR